MNNFAIAVIAGSAARRAARGVRRSVHVHALRAERSGRRPPEHQDGDVDARLHLPRARRELSRPLRPRARAAVDGDGCDGRRMRTTITSPRKPARRKFVPPASPSSSIRSRRICVRAKRKRNRSPRSSRRSPRRPQPRYARHRYGTATLTMPKTEAINAAKAKGYTGNACGECGQLTMVRNGACEKCDSCGSTSGCS